MKKIYKLLNRRGNVQRRIQGGGSRGLNTLHGSVKWFSGGFQAPAGAERLAPHAKKMLK